MSLSDSSPMVPLSRTASSTPVSDEHQPGISQPSQPSTSSLGDFVSALSSVDVNAPNASQNATSIDDGNGGRIELNFDKQTPKMPPAIVKK